MAGESTTHCESVNHAFGRGFERETEVVMATPDETLRLESPADGWEDSVDLCRVSSLCSRGTFLFDFRWVEMVPNKPIWEGGGTAAVEDHAFVETTSVFANKVLRSAGTSRGAGGEAEASWTSKGCC